MGSIHARILVLTLAATGLAVSEVAAADAGLETFIEKRCYTCHTIAARADAVEGAKVAFLKEQGIDAAGEAEEEKEKRGGDLSDVGTKREAEWLKTLLKSPKGEFKDTPDCQREAKKKDRKKFKGTPEELDALVALLMGLKSEAKHPPGFTSCLQD